jgi:hypothetical protein
MSGHPSGEYDSKSVIPFGTGCENASSYDADQLDKAGQTILGLLHKAAGVAEENSRYVLDTAQKLSDQLKAAENRIAELEVEIEIYQEKAGRAEQWLRRVYTEIEDRFLRQNDSRRESGAPRRTQVVKTAG